MPKISRTKTELNYLHLPRMTKYGWVGPILIACSPLLMLESSAELSLIERGVFFALIFFVFSWFLRQLILKTPMTLMPLDLPIIFLFFYFAFDFCKVLFFGMKIEAWLHWRKFVFLLVYFPISREFCSIKRIDRMFILLIFIGFLFSILRLDELLATGSISDLYPATTINRIYPWWSLLLLVGMVNFLFIKQVGISRGVKLLFILALSICLINLLTGAARTPLITLSLCCLLSIFFSIKEQRKLPVALIVILLLTFGFLYYFSDLYSQYVLRLQGSVIEFSLEMRAERYRVALERFLESPVIGDTERQPFYYYHIRRKIYELGSIHSLYFYILANGGLVGCVVFFFFMYKIFSFLVKVFKLKMSLKLRMYLEASFVTTLSMFVAGVTSTAMFRVESWLFLGILLGLVSCIYQLAGETYTHST